MPLLQVEAEKLSNNDLIAGVVEEIIDRDAMFAMLPFVRTEGKAYVYNRENTISEGAFIDPNATVTEEASTFTEVTTKLKILIGDVDVDKFLSTTMSDTSSQVAIQLAQKAKGMGRKFRRTLAIGDSAVTSQEFDGIKALTTGAMTMNAGANGGAITLDLMDQLKDMVKNGADAYVMRPGTWLAVKSLLRALGGTTPVHVELPNFGVPVPAFDGTPVLLNEFLPVNETLGTGTDLCSVYAVRFNEVDGLHGLYGGDAAGFQLENIGTVQNKDANRWRMKWYCGTALKSTQSLARLEGVTNT